MIETLKKMEMIMPLPVWGCIIGIINGYILLAGYIIISDWFKSRRK